MKIDYAVASLLMMFSIYIVNPMWYVITVTLITLNEITLIAYDYVVMIWKFTEPVEVKEELNEEL